MTGYHNDQFFRLASPNSGENSSFSDVGTNGAGYALRGADNPPFVYPDRTIRTQDHEGSKSQGLKRGYIRSLATYTGGGTEMDIRKCQFQFNPSTLTQSVESAQSTLNFAQMDPGQYAVPRATSVNFTFDLLFDRSMELNNSRGVDAPADGVNPWQLGAPSQVGILRDLAAFYGVIGQSIDPSQAAYMEKSLIESIKAEASTVTSETVEEDTAKAIANVPGFIKANAANSAFLLPTPVRVMFSTLYVVEGFVTNTTVAFTKFNTAMVPMQCALSVTMEAKYIGFASKNTFLQWSLEERRNRIIADEKAEAERVKSLHTAFSVMTSLVEVGACTGSGQSGPQKTVTSNIDELTSFETGSAKGYPFEIYTQFPMANRRSEETDPVSVLMSDYPDTITVQTQAQFAVIGPITSTTPALPPSPSQQDLADKIRQAAGANILYGIMQPSQYNAAATTSKQWRDMAKRATSHSLAFFFSKEYDPLEYYILTAIVTVTVRDSNGETISATGTRHILVRPFNGVDDVPLVVGVPLNWPTAPPVPGTTVSTVPQDNATTAPPSPGSPSPVGNPGVGLVRPI